MPPTAVRTSAATLQRVERAAGDLSSAATRRVEASHDWYRALSAEDRSWVGLVAQAGIAAFIAWLREGGDQTPVTADVFGTAPRELTRSITLRQTLDLVRSVVDVVSWTPLLWRSRARSRPCASPSCGTRERSPSLPLRSTPTPPRPAARGTPGSRDSSS